MAPTRHGRINDGWEQKHSLLTIPDCPVEVKAQILAPLAVLPDYRSNDIGCRLIKEGVRQLKEAGTDLIFVLGHIEYYPRSGFVNDAKRLRLQAVLTGSKCLPVRAHALSQIFHKNLNSFGLYS